MKDFELELVEAKAAMHEAIGKYNSLLIKYNSKLRKPWRYVECSYFNRPVKKEQNDKDGN